jgi:hypothetical protein
MKLEWSAIALADLDRFAAFLHDRHPRLAQVMLRVFYSREQRLSSGAVQMLES